MNLCLSYDVYSKNIDTDFLNQVDVIKLLITIDNL